jgi:hypothetical protein
VSPNICGRHLVYFIQVLLLPVLNNSREVKIMNNPKKKNVNGPPLSVRVKLLPTNDLEFKFTFSQLYVEIVAAELSLPAKAVDRELKHEAQEAFKDLTRPLVERLKQGEISESQLAKELDGLQGKITYDLDFDAIKARINARLRLDGLGLGGL